MASLQDFYTNMATQAVKTPNSPYAKALDANAAFLMPFFNMPSQQQGPNVPTTQQPSAPAPTPAPTKAAATVPTQTQQPAATPAPAAPEKGTEPAGLTLGAESAGMFKQEFGRSPTMAELQKYVQGQFVPEQTDTGTDMFSMFGINKEDPNSLYDQFGLEKPEYQAPDSQEYKDLTAERQDLADIDRREELQKRYEMEVENITAKYNIEREQLAERVENSRQEQISGLYNVGVVNPLSSGLASIGTASEKYHNQQKGLLAQLEAAEKQKAYAQFFDLETKEIDRRREIIQNQITSLEEQAQAEYDARVADFDRGVQLVDKLVSVWKENNRVEEKQRSDAQDAFNDLISNFGSGAFTGMNAADLAELESALGYPAGSLQSGITALKKKELSEGDELELRTIGGSLYNVYKDAEGNVKADLIIAKPAGSGGGGTSASDKDLKAMFNDADALRDDLASGKIDWGQAYNRLARQYPDFNVPDNSGRTILDDALGGSGGYDAATGSFDPGKATGYAVQGSQETTGKISDDAVRNYIGLAKTGKGKKATVDIEKIPSDVRTEVVNRATALGIFQ